MAINFEAANMAGYNNPKIEVFEAIINPETNAITEAPAKTEFIRCLRRGSIPAILLTTTDGSDSNLLWLYAWATAAEGDSIYFANLAYIIVYLPGSDSPIVSTGG